MGRTPAQQSSDLQVLTAKTQALLGPANSISSKSHTKTRERRTDLGYASWFLSHLILLHAVLNPRPYLTDKKLTPQSSTDP